MIFKKSSRAQQGSAEHFECQVRGALTFLPGKMTAHRQTAIRRLLVYRAHVGIIQFQRFLPTKTIEGLGMKLYGVVGAGGFGREVIPVAKEYLGMICNAPFKLVFIDDGISESKVNGYDVLTTDQFFDTDADEYFFNIAIGSGKVREKVADAMLNKGAKPFRLFASNAISLDANEIGDGAVLCPFTMVTSNSKIGKYFQANIYSYVAHDCIIGDFVTFAPGVKCNGNVVIEDHAYIGTGALIKQGTPKKPIVIGAGAVIGMGAVVTKSVAPGTTVVGNPAKPLRAGLGG